MARGIEMLVYPELALATFFPRWDMEDQHYRRITAQIGATVEV